MLLHTRFSRGFTLLEVLLVLGLMLATTVLLTKFGPRQKKPTEVDAFAEFVSGIVFQCRQKSAVSREPVKLEISANGTKFVITYKDKNNKEQTIEKFFNVKGIRDCKIFTHNAAYSKKEQDTQLTNNSVIFTNKFFHAFQIQFNYKDEKTGKIYRRKILVDQFSAIKVDNAQ